MKWISVKDRLPLITKISVNEYRCSEDVLCINKLGICYVARWSEQEGNRFNFWNPSGIQGKLSRAQSVTHWMPLPPPPEPPNDEGVE